MILKISKNVPGADENLHLLIAAARELAHVALAGARGGRLGGRGLGLVLLEEVHTLFI